VKDEEDSNFSLIQKLPFSKMVFKKCYSRWFSRLFSYLLKTQVNK
jgi:hypothetical protein